MVDMRERKARSIWKLYSKEKESRRLTMASKLDLARVVCEREEQQA